MKQNKSVLSVLQFAKRAGVSRTIIQYYLKNGRIESTPREVIGIHERELKKIPKLIKRADAGCNLSTT